MAAQKGEVTHNDAHKRLTEWANEITKNIPNFVQDLAMIIVDYVTTPTQFRIWSTALLPNEDKTALSIETSTSGSIGIADEVWEPGTGTKVFAILVTTSTFAAERDKPEYCSTAVGIVPHNLKHLEQFIGLGKPGYCVDAQVNRKYWELQSSGANFPSKCDPGDILEIHCHLKGEKQEFDGCVSKWKIYWYGISEHDVW